ncbi:LuxR C-terminal-related transcriptional regulator [Adlercreutzia caecimuris]|uniref:LuxR C-terminal-related transcriptional regulator n=1 Tax=Adlercreutzia caecimuris TaxID=671266 RepID=UPI0024941BBA|nr:LuxR C-terminal-related transcriptional regulator [Adlercreutzia caecimuris]
MGLCFGFSSPATVALLGCALGLNSAWVGAVFQNVGIFSFGGNAESVLDAVYLVSIAALIVTLLLIGFLEHRAGRLLARPPVLWGSAALTALSTALMPLGALEPPEGPLIMAATGVLSGIASGVFLMYFGMALSRVSLREAVGAVAIGQMASPLLLVTAVALGAAPGLAISAALPAGAATLLWFAIKRIRAASSISVIGLDDQRPPVDADERHQVARLVFRISLCVGLVGFAHELMRTLYIQMDIATAGAHAYALAQALVGAAAVIGAVLVGVAMMSVKTLSMPRLCYWGITFFLMVGILLGPAPLLWGPLGSVTPYAVNQAAHSCFSLFMWIMSAALCQRFSSTRVRTFALIRAGWAIGPLIGLLLGRFALMAAGLAAPAVYGCMLVAVFAAFFAMGAVFNERVLMETMDVLPLERRERFQDRCRFVIERYGLSEREGEIMIMFAKGRNLAYIQEELFISKSTVSTHRQHIYKKLGIHSQQELLDLVQAADPYGK